MHGPALPFKESLARAEAQLWIFESFGRALTEIQAARLQELAPRPRLVPGVSVVLAGSERSPELAACLVHFRDAVPLIPLLCALPKVANGLRSEIERLCGFLGVRVVEHDGSPDNPDPGSIEQTLRQQRLAPDLEFISFLDRRGHSVRHRAELSPLIGELLQASRMVEVGPRDPEQRRVWLKRSRSLLEKAGLPALKQLSTILRLVSAGIRLYSPSRPTVRQVATGLGFSSAFSLSNEMVRYLGSRPSEVRNLYPWEWMLDRALPEQCGH